MASSYPSGLDAFATNRTDGTVMATTHATDHNNENDAINKIEAELGTLPKGGYASVRARLDGISGASGTVTGWVNVKDQGAVGNGTADDTSAVQAAINTATPNGCVYFPAGTYKIVGSGGVGLDLSSTTGISLYGAPSGGGLNPSGTDIGVNIVTPTASLKLFKAESVSLNHKGPRMSNIMLRDDNTSATLFSISNYNNYQFDNVVFSCQGGTSTGTGLKIDGPSDASYGHLFNCRFFKNATALIGTNSVGFKIFGGYIQIPVNGVGVDVQGGGAIGISGVKFEALNNSGAIGARLGNVGSGASFAMMNCDVEGVATGVSLVAQTSLQNSAVRIVGCDFTGHTGSETGISIGTNNNNTYVVANRFSNLTTSVADSGTNTHTF